MRTRSALAFVLAATFVLVAQSRPALAADPWEGTKWKVVVTPDNDAQKAGAKEFKDMLAFKGGKFTDDEFAKHGFGPVMYEEDTRGAKAGMAGFTADQKSEKEGTARWSGNKTGGEIKGNLVWKKKDGTVLNYTFSGEKQ
jgi:hypothetical protein